jgi:hypothetical protein
MDYVCSELYTYGRKRDGSTLFEESARNVCCSPEAGGINPSCATQEKGCFGVLAVRCGLFYCWILIKDATLLYRIGSAIVACIVDCAI